MNDRAKAARWCHLASIAFFVAFTFLGSGSTWITSALGAATGVLAQISGTFAWALMCVAYSLQIQQKPKPAP